MKAIFSTHLAALLVACTLLLATACQEGSSDALQGGTVAIYAVKEDNKDSVLKDLSLEAKPLLTSADIDFYDFTGHVLHLKRDIALPKSKGSFVVIANGERCYQGVFQPGYMSALYPGVLINVSPRHYPDDILAIDFVAVAPGTIDPRTDFRVRAALMKEGKYQVGLSGELTAVKAIGPPNALTVQYTYILHNQGTETLYVLDPDRMESRLFHYFTTGTILTGENGLYGAVYQQVVDPVLSSTIQERWFTAIEKGQSLTRTVTLEKYQQVPTGRYESYLVFASPFTVTKSQRLLGKGRIWLGSIYMQGPVVDMP